MYIFVFVCCCFSGSQRLHGCPRD